MVPLKAAPKLDILQATRLFSNVALNGNQLNHRPGSVLGSTALVAGTTVGAGVLALPAVTLPSGVVPSTVLLIGVWFYALVSGLLIAEIVLNAIRLTGQPSVGLLATVKSTLGLPGARIAGAAYLFLHYALLIAYTARGGGILLSAVEQIWGVQHVIPTWVGTTSFTLLFGGMMYLGQERLVEKLNSAFVAIVIASFLGLLLLAWTQVNPSHLLFQNWSALPAAVSVMFVALFYHNVIPAIAVQLEGDVCKIRSSIIIGSAIPLVMFLAWNAVILGSVNPDMVQGFHSSTVFDPLQILRSGGAGKWLGVLVAVFSEFAIATSFIGFVYGLLDFYQGMINVSANEPAKRLWLYSLILFPPISLGTLNPNIFFTALDYAGTFSISVLGGIMPAVMLWKQREELQNLNQSNQPLVFGGKATLVVVVGVALVVIGQQIVSTVTSYE